MNDELKSVYCELKDKDVVWVLEDTSLSNTYELRCLADSEDCEDCLASKYFQGEEE